MCVKPGHAKFQPSSASGGLNGRVVGNPTKTGHISKTVRIVAIDH